MDTAMDNCEVAARLWRQIWISMVAAAGGDGGRWRLMVTLDNGDGCSGGK
jgi:hypothetical protein